MAPGCSSSSFCLRNLVRLPPNRDAFLGIPIKPCSGPRIDIDLVFNVDSCLLTLVHPRVPVVPSTSTPCSFAQMLLIPFVR